MARAAIKKRLSPTTDDDDLAVVTDNLTIDLVDPFMTKNCGRASPLQIGQRQLSTTGVGPDTDFLVLMKVIKKRLSPTTDDDDLAVVTDNLTIDLVDPFMARIFDIWSNSATSMTSTPKAYLEVLHSSCPKIISSRTLSHHRRR
jgi:hypothetical protein